MDQPVNTFTPEALNVLYYGSGDETYDVVRYFGKEPHRQKAKFDGVVGIIEQRMAQGMSNDYYEQFVEEASCPDCHGKRLSPASLSVTVGGMNIYDFCCLSVREALDFINGLGEQLVGGEAVIARDIIKEIRSRLSFLVGDRGTGLPDAGAQGRRADPAVRHSVSGWQRRSVRRWWACCIFWTSRLSDCISVTTANSIATL